VLLLLVIPFGLLWLVIAANRRRFGFGNLSIRGALVLAYLAFEVLLLGITELSSVGHHFTAGTVAIAWVIVIILLLFVARTQITLLIQRARSRDGARFGLREHMKRLTGEDRFWIGVLVAIFGVLVALGFLYLTSTGDSMVYHLVRVAHWIQNGTVAPFAAHYLPQVDLSPLSEYNLAHLQLLSGGDRFDSCMQLSGALICIVGVSELARLLGASRSTQIAASVICATIPSGVLLATSTENDYFTAAAGVGVLMILLAFSLEGRWVYRAAALGAAIGLAYMAKSTTSFLLGPAVLALIAVVVYRRVRTAGGLETLRGGINQVLVVAASAVAIIGVFVVQTEQLFGSFVGSTASGLVSSPLTIAGFGANVDRSVAANFDIGDGVAGIDTYVSMVALGILRHVYSVFGVPLNDVRFTLLQQNGDPFAAGNYTLFQRVGEFGANPWNILLAVTSLAVLAVAVARGRKEFRVALVLGLSLVCGFVFFTGIAKWSNNSVRYQLPVLVALSAVIAVGLSIFPRWITRLVLVGLVVSCLPQLLDNTAAPLVPPYQYHGSYLAPYFGQFSQPPGAVEALAYQTITTMLAESTCRQAAIGNFVHKEYPLWVGLKHEHYRGVLNDFNVPNATRRLEPSYRPCASITEQGKGYVTPNNGTVNVQQSDLALSIDASKAATIQNGSPRFRSTVRGVRVLPGGGWNLTGFGTIPLLINSGSLYVFSNSAQPIHLLLHLVPKVPQSTVGLFEVDGQAVPTTMGHDSIEADLDLRRGVTRINIGTEPNGVAHRRLLILSDVTLTPAGS
jgi:hypothetical protein